MLIRLICCKLERIVKSCTPAFSLSVNDFRKSSAHVSRDDTSEKNTEMCLLLVYLSFVDFFVANMARSVVIAFMSVLYFPKIVANVALLQGVVVVLQ